MRSLAIPLLLTALDLFSQKVCDYAIEGVILDIETNQPLAFATIKIEGTNQGTIADEAGYFALKNVCDKEVHLEVRFLGYKTLVHHHDQHHANPTIYLAPNDNELQSVIVEGRQTDRIASIAVQKKEISKIATLGSSIGELSSQLTGVSLLSTGANVSKPMIHGLHSNRVLVINNGVRHGYQAWAEEHAPEIDPSNVEQIEVVKGAATVKYGPEALGGVILYNAIRPSFDQPLGGSFGSSYKTNGRAYSSQLNLKQGSHRFAWNVSGFGIYQGDLKAPDYNLSNTGKREYGGSFNTYLHRPKFDMQVSGSYFTQELGILRGSIVGSVTDLQNAIDRSKPNPTFDPTYSIQNPKQETKHGLLKYDLSVFAGEHIFNLEYAIQQNLRKEFDIRRGENNNRPIMDLELITHNIETEWIQPTIGSWSGSTGIQVYTQNSDNKPGTNTVNFIPYYDILNMGVYAIQSIKKENTTYELGVRFDNQSIKVADTTTITEEVIYSRENDFSNFTFTLGLRKKFNQHLTFFSNLGTAWRPPNVAEVYSYGYHHARIQFGLWRYEFNPNISTLNILDESSRATPSERSIKWVTGLETKKDQYQAELVFYANQINNYIFLRPNGVTVGIAGTFPYFLYDQTNAFFIGSDWDIRFFHSRKFTSEVKVSYVYASETENKQPLLEIPPLNIDYSLDYLKGAFGYSFNLNYTARQWHAPGVIDPIRFQEGTVEVDPNVIFDFMAPPESYLLIGGRIFYQKDRWKLDLNIQNMVNKSYRIYTDRLRYYTDAIGRNVSFSLEYSF